MIGPVIALVVFACVAMWMMGPFLSLTWPVIVGMVIASLAGVPITLVILIGLIGLYARVGSDTLHRSGR